MTMQMRAESVHVRTPCVVVNTNKEYLNLVKIMYFNLNLELRRVPRGKA